MTAGWRQQAAGLLLLFLLAGACLALDSQQNCSRNQYEAHGRCCRRCPPGEKVSVLCTEDVDTTCIPCQARHFQDVWTKEKVCTPHRSCDQIVKLMVRLSGTASQDAVCQCQDGYHCSNHECLSCRKNLDCGPGEGVKQTATDMTDTVCTECPEGFFSNISSATASCQRWSSCEASGLVRKADGTRFSDTVCEEAPKDHLGVVVPVALAAVIVLLGCLGLLWHQRGRRCQRLPKGHDNQVQQDPERWQQQPSEDDEACPALPIQETRPTSPEGAKDSCSAEQECAP